MHALTFLPSYAGKFHRGTLIFMQVHYRVKIINPNKKSDFMVRDLHHVIGKFDSIISLKLKIMDEFGELVPATTDFQIGYFRGKQSTKYWLMCQDDLEMMNESLQKGNGKVVLWCDGRSTKSSDSYDPVVASHGRKRRSAHVSEPVMSKRQQLDEDIQDIVQDLKDKHGSKYSLPQLRWWARMIVAGNHDSNDDPPQIPAITGIQPKREKKPSLSDAIAGAAITFANAVQSPTVQQCNKQSVVIFSDAMSTPEKSNTAQATGISPGKITELRMKKLRELRELQELLEQNILTQQEFSEQKQLVLHSLRRLTH